MRVPYLLFFLSLAACNGKSENDADADADADTDADTDSDADADSDADTDSDSDTDADTDSDTDADTDSDTDADTDSDTDADTDADADTAPTGDTASPVDTAPDADTGDTGSSLTGDTAVPPPDPQSWTAVGASSVSADFTIGADTYAVRGDDVRWLAVVATTDTPDQAAWVSGIGASGALHTLGASVGGARVAVDPATRDVYVGFVARPTDGSTPTTIELTDPSGAVVTSTTTFADITGLGVNGYREPFLAKFDASGTPLWVKRLAHGPGTYECHNLRVAALNVAGGEILVTLNAVRQSDPDTTAQPLTLGPGDTNEATYGLRENHRAVFTLALSKTDGQLRIFDVLDDVTNAQSAVAQGFTFVAASMMYDPVGARYAVGGGVNHFGTTEVRYAMQTGTTGPAVPQPRGDGYRAIFGTYSASDLSVGLNQAAASNSSSDTMHFVYPLTDGATLVSAVHPSTTAATYTSSAGNQVYTGGQDDQAWLALYDATAEVDWAKRVDTTPDTGFFEWLGAVDSTAQGQLHVLGRARSVTAVTLGQGEAGQTTFTDLDDTTHHLVLATVDRTTGDLAWARLLEQTSVAPDVNALGLLFAGAPGTLDIHATLSGDVSIDGQAQSYGSGVHWTKTTFDLDGVLQGTSVLATLAGGANAGAVHVDITP